MVVGPQVIGSHPVSFRKQADFLYKLTVFSKTGGKYVHLFLYNTGEGLVVVFLDL